MEDHTTIKLTLPRQDFTGVPLFEPNTVAASDWVQSLPVTNTNTLVGLLGQALGELNRTTLPPEVRYGVMEILLPSINVAVSNLSKRYLNQPLIMPQEPRQMARLSDELLSMASTGYTIVAIDTLQQRDAISQTNPARLMCESVQRALVFAGRRVLQNFQLHQAMGVHGWQSLHQLYALADSQRLVDLPVTEPLSGGNTIKTTYLQAILIGCCKANQLRQSDLSALYRGLQHWSERVTFDGRQTGNDLFMVDLDSDHPPLYIALHKEERGPSCRYIDTMALTRHLTELKEEAGGNAINFDKNTNAPVSLLDHLIASLGSMSLRNFKRTMTDNALLICVGLSSTHYHVAGKRLFEQLVFGDDPHTNAEQASSNPFLKPLEKVDLWQTANPGDFSGDLQLHPNQLIDIDSTTRARLLHENNSDLPAEERYPVFQVKLADASPGGYCVEWTAALPGDIKAGDIVGLKESVNGEWVIAVIRWISRLTNSRTLIGLELLSPRAIAYGASIHQKGGQNAPPIRVLLLPEIKLVGQPQTLVTPRTGFKEQQKITLGTCTEATSIQLLRHVASTGSFSQFEFTHIKELGDLLADNGHGQLDGEYDSLWSNI